MRVVVRAICSLCSVRFLFFIRRPGWRLKQRARVRRPVIIFSYPKASTTTTTPPSPVSRTHTPPYIYIYIYIWDENNAGLTELVPCTLRTPPLCVNSHTQHTLSRWRTSHTSQSNLYLRLSQKKTRTRYSRNTPHTRLMLLILYYIRALWARCVYDGNRRVSIYACGLWWVLYRDGRPMIGQICWEYKTLVITFGADIQYGRLYIDATRTWETCASYDVRVRPKRRCVCVKPNVALFNRKQSLYRDVATRHVSIEMFASDANYSVYSEIPVRGWHII